QYDRPDADYYLLAGTPTELFGELVNLSGHAELFPKWANGFINSQWGIDEQEFRDIASCKLKADMDALGVHMTGIMKPRVHVDTVEGRYATAHDLWLPGEKASPDYFSH